MSARVLASTKGMDRAEWLAIRRQGIGASEAPAVCGIDRYRGPVSVWADKVGLANPDDAGEAAFWGTVLEPVIAQQFQALHDIPVRRVNAVLQSERYPWMIANLDRETVGEREPVEIKAHSVYRREEWANDRAPDTVLVQLHHQMLVVERTAGWAVCLLGGQELIVRRVEFDPELAGLITAAEERLWQHVQDGTVPEPTAADDDALDGLWPSLRPDDEPVELGEHGRQALADYQAASATEKAASADKADARARLLAALGDHAVGTVDGATAVTARHVETRRADVDTYLRWFPDHAPLLDACRSTSTSRRIHIPKPKGKR